ncbi:MAG TPA: ABC transporter permease subunit [Actinomycetota bacterium]|nr:ABC transporter permease subunit [Actinomycetota bacterium]
MVAQVLFLVAVAGFIGFLLSNLRSNLSAQGIRTDFGFLDQSAGFRIPDSSFRAEQSVRDAILVGMRNTIAVALVGILFATIVGVLTGIARLSRNWLVRKAASVYVETIRNVPPLVVIFFFWLAVILTLPPIEDAVEWFGVTVFSNDGLVFPSVSTKPGASSFWPVVGLAFVTGIVTWIVRSRSSDRTGDPSHRAALSTGLFFVVLVAGFFILGRPLEAALPERGEFGTTGGLRLNPEFASLGIALVLYTATHIAEIVRGALLAVPRGQTEAATALGLPNRKRLRYVILPQALRIAVPPIANQYLNLTKNTSLAVAIGFPEVTGVVSIAVGQGSPAPQSFAVLMLVYLVISLTISAVVNVANRRLVLKGR